MALPTVSVWNPPEGVTRHSESAIPEDLVFFGSPPPEIGNIITADSTLTQKTKPMNGVLRVILSIGIGLFAGVILWSLLSIFVSTGVIGLLIAFALSIAVTYLAFGFSATCSFVGDKGIAEFTINGVKDTTPTVQTTKFEEISHLYTSQTRRYKNFIYQGTDYNYEWKRSDDIVHTISGTYHNEKGFPEDKDPWHFGNSAEIAWTNHLLHIANEDLERLGYIEFPMAGNPQMVRVGQGFLEFVTSQGDSQKVTVDDMQDVRLESGKFYFKHKDAQWWSGKGKYNFSYGEMPNVKLFWLCLHRLTGLNLT